MTEFGKSCLIAVGAGLVAAAAVTAGSYAALKATGNEEVLLDIRHKWMRSVSSTENMIHNTHKTIRSAISPDADETDEEDMLS